MQQNSQTQKNKHLLFSYWDILPLLTLVCYIIAFAAIRPKILSLDISGFANPDRTILEFIVMATLFWLIMTIVILIGKPVMAVLNPMRSIATTGLLLFGFAVVLRPIIGKVALGLGLGVFFLSILIAILAIFTRTKSEEQDVSVNDPARCPEFWKCGDMFYFNKEDKRLFVPRLHQNTYSEFTSATNFGHKRAWLISIIPGSVPLIWIITQLIVSIIYHK